MGDLPIVGSLVGLLGYTLWFISKADRRIFQLADRQEGEIKALQTKMTNLENKSDDLEMELLEYTTGTRILIRQIRSLGQTPYWYPNDWDDKVL